MAALLSRRQPPNRSVILMVVDLLLARLVTRTVEPTGIWSLAAPGPAFWLKKVRLPWQAEFPAAWGLLTISTLLLRMTFLPGSRTRSMAALLSRRQPPNRSVILMVADLLLSRLVILMVEPAGIWSLAAAGAAFWLKKVTLP